MTPLDLDAQKQALRRETRGRRVGMAPEDAAGAAAQNGLQALAASTFEVIAGFIAIRGELDPAPLMAALAARGADLCLPFVQGAALPLGFRRYRPGDPLVPGPYGTREPGPEAAAAVPSVVLVPLLAFDRKGWRLGYGGGYYDRTLSALRASGPVRAIGLAYSIQEVPAVPHDERDEPLDLVVTERGVLSCAEDE